MVISEFIMGFIEFCGIFVDCLGYSDMPWHSLNCAFMIYLMDFCTSMCRIYKQNLVKNWCISIAQNNQQRPTKM